MGLYLCQLKALIKRNIQMKKASKSQTIMEIFFPIFMILMTYFYNELTETETYKARTPLEPIDSLSAISTALEGIEDITLGFILPENNQDESIIQKNYE